MKEKGLAIVLVISVVLLLLLIASCTEKTTTEPKRTVTKPVIDPPGGNYNLPQEVVISCETDGAIIKYTTDSTEPNQTSRIYVSPIIISEDTNLIARAFKEGWEDSELVTVGYQITQTIDDLYSLTMTAEPRVIYSDNNITTSNVHVRVRDKQNFPVSGKIVRFRSNIGQIASQVLTDEMGIVTTKFYDAGEVGEAIIDAFVDDNSASVVVTIEETPAVDRIEMLSIPNILGLGQVQTLHARAMDVNDNPVADGTIITFSASKGFFEENDIDGGNNLGYTVNGWASVLWNTGTWAGPVTITARVGTVIGEVNSQIATGPPAYVYLTPETRVGSVWVSLPSGGLPVNYGNDVRIRADVKDLYNNAVRAGIPLLFNTDLGSIIGVASTDNSGVAYARFFPGVVAGTAIITATTRPPDEIVGVTEIRIYSEDVHTISFSNDNPVFLDVRGVGGVESRPLIVYLKDFEGSLVTGQHWVSYQIVRGPDGVNLNNAGLQVDVMATDGVASASINSGTESGTVNLKVSLIDNPQIYTTSNIIIISGPPVNFDIFISDYDTEVSIGGGLWRLQAGALMTDVYGNGVIDGTIVHFSLAQDPAPPANTTIGGVGYTGNPGLNGIRVPGIAFTQLIYHGRNSNEWITIIAESGGLNERLDFKLPVQQPSLHIMVNPSRVTFFNDDNGTNPAYKDVEILCRLRDGQGNYIANSKIQLLGGNFIYHPEAVPNPPIPPTPQYIYTLDGTGGFGSRGYAYGMVRIHGWELPPPVDEWFTRIDIAVSALLFGTDVRAATNIEAIRYQFVEP